ncbi:MAG: hypothetical protein AAFO86_06665 [Pseudomonadota bacterium]
MIADVITRLEAQIAELAGRVEGAFEFGELVRTGQMPNSGVAAHVLPLGLQPRAADSAAGAYTQEFDESIGVILTLRNASQDAERILGNLRDFVMRIVRAIAGWVPAGASGVFRFLRASLISSTKGTFVYQIDFTIADQLRILDD